MEQFQCGKRYTEALIRIGENFRLLGGTSRSYNETEGRYGVELF